MDKDDKFTSIAISKEFKLKLKEMGEMGDSYEKIIKILYDFYQEKSDKSP